MSEQILLFGAPLETLPQDLYIPPDALCVLLEIFEGPLDLLLYLVRKAKMDILVIPISEITEQYLVYIRMMQTLDITLASEYLLMAATLSEMKSRLLLPVLEREDEPEEEDMAFDLSKRLLAYAQLVDAAEKLSELPRIDSGIAVSAYEYIPEQPRQRPRGDLTLLLQAAAQLRYRQKVQQAHEISREQLPLAPRIALMQSRLEQENGWHDLRQFYQNEEGTGGLVVSLLALLELDRRQFLEWQQECAFAAVQLRKRA